MLWQRVSKTLLNLLAEHHHLLDFFPILKDENKAVLCTTPYICLSTYPTHVT